MMLNLFAAVSLLFLASCGCGCGPEEKKEVVQQEEIVQVVQQEDAGLPENAEEYAAEQIRQEAFADLESEDDMQDDDGDEMFAQADLETITKLAMGDPNDIEDELQDDDQGDEILDQKA